MTRTGTVLQDLTGFQCDIDGLGDTLLLYGVKSFTDLQCVIGNVSCGWWDTLTVPGC